MLTNNHITKEEVIALLTQDDYYRKQKEWPLINSFKFLDKKYVKRSVADMFTIRNYNAHQSPFNLKSLADVKFSINTIFPFTDELLLKFQGNLVACGGSICKAIIDICNPSDIDFFFYDLTIQQTTQKRAEIIEFLIKSWKAKVGAKVTRCHGSYIGKLEKTIIKEVKFYIQRNEFVTTIHVEELCDYREDPVVYEYQFIHRIYPNISSIIGGFDLSASMVAYDGKEIYTTPLSYWSYTNRYIIVDMGRRSTSFEHRLGKYQNYGFGIIFPGLEESSIDNLINLYKAGSFPNFIRELEVLAKENGYTINNFGNLRKEFTKISDNDELFFYKLQKDKDILKYLILNIERNHFVTQDSDDNYNVFIKRSNGNQYDWDAYDDDDEEIKAKCDDKEYFMKKISDYSNDEKYILSISDYSHNYMWHKHAPHANATKLRLNNLAAVVSLIYIDDNDNIKEKLQKDLDDPNLGINDFSIGIYMEKVEEIMEKYDLIFKWSNQKDSREMIRLFGSLFTKILQDKNKYKEVRDIMINKIIDNNEICKKNLTGIKWITENP